MLPAYLSCPSISSGTAAAKACIASFPRRGTAVLSHHHAVLYPTSRPGLALISTLSALILHLLRTPRTLRTAVVDAQRRLVGQPRATLQRGQPWTASDTPGYPHGQYGSCGHNQSIAFVLIVRRFNAVNVQRYMALAGSHGMLETGLTGCKNRHTTVNKSVGSLNTTRSACDNVVSWKQWTGTQTPKTCCLLLNSGKLVFASTFLTR